MAKYRPVDIRVWTDRKFNTLSDDGKLLWLFLLTTPATLPIPGVIVGGPAGLAEQLGWDVERFTKGLGELFRKGLGIRFDMASRLVWLSKAGDYQRASGENVFKGWAKTWDDVPNCPLKLEIWQSIQASKQFPKLFAQLFQEPLLEPFPNGQRQEQEQEQEQEQDIPLSPLTGAAAPSAAARPRSRTGKAKAPDLSPAEAESVAGVLDKLSRESGTPFRATSVTHQRVLVARLREGVTEDELRAVILHCADPKPHGLGWRDNPEMRAFLRPETLFGPTTIERYLPAARKMLAEMEASP